MHVQWVFDALNNYLDAVCDGRLRGMCRYFVDTTQSCDNAAALVSPSHYQDRFEITERGATCDAIFR